MKKFAEAFLVVALTSAVYASPRLQAEAESRTLYRPAPCGDLNADEGVNLSDAVFLLQSLFGGGEQPDCPAPAAPSLPETGQQICYDEEGEEFSCDEEEYPGQDGLHATGCSADTRFVDNQDGTITDRCTGLVWQQETADINEDGVRRVIDDALHWNEALAFSADLTLGGYDDWRLPSMRELGSIIDYGRSRPSTDPVFDSVPSDYWSSTTYLGLRGYGWVASADTGHSGRRHKAIGRALVRAVRGAQRGEPRGEVLDPAIACADLNADDDVSISDAVFLLQYLFAGGRSPDCPEQAIAGLPDTGQQTCYSAEGDEESCDEERSFGQDGLYSTGCPAEGRFVDNRDGTVTDTCTGLVWQRQTADISGDGMVHPSDDAVHWSEALTYCDELTLGGHDDWRLPNIRELVSLIDYGRYDPTSHRIFGTISGGYWSSTSFVNYPKLAWGVNFEHGSIVHIDKAFVSRVRAVRGGLRSD